MEGRGVLSARQNRRTAGVVGNIYMW